MYNCFMDSNLIYLEEVNSTNTYVKDNINNLSSRTVVYTSCQTHGRGRFNHVWNNTGSENIYMTICLKEKDISNFVLHNITQYTSIVICRILKKYRANPEIKWPNDILIDNKKISGILAETVFKGSKCSGIALGIGININSSEHELAEIQKPAAALNLIVGYQIKRELFINQFLDEFWKNYNEFMVNGFKLIKEEYIQYTNFLNKKIQVNDTHSVIEGIAENISNDGELLLNCNGTILKLCTGEILKL